MNDKQTKLLQILDIVVDCCALDLGDGRMSVTKEDVLSKNRNENVVLTREILCMMIINAGYTITTAAMMLNRTMADIRHLIDNGYSHERTSQAFRYAYAEATLRVRELE